jgi:hypothetical protein
VVVGMAKLSGRTTYPQHGPSLSIVLSQAQAYAAACTGNKSCLFKIRVHAVFD